MMGCCYNPYPNGFTLFVDGCLPFDVLDKETWYHIDASHPVHEQYKDVPQEIQLRAKRAILSALDEGGIALGYTVDPAPYYEAALREEFDGVRFLGTDFVPGVVM